MTHEFKQREIYDTRI